MATAPRHLERTQRYLKFARQNIPDGEYRRAADALRRAVTHAASAFLAAEGRPTRTRRRLHGALNEQVCMGQIPHAHLTTFRRVHRLPALLDTSGPTGPRRILRTMRARVVRMAKDIAAAIAAQAAERDDGSPPPGLINDRPSLFEMHTTTPARCNNLSIPLGAPRGSQLLYDPAVCPKCANLFRPPPAHAS